MIDLARAAVYDVEVLKNAFTLTYENLNDESGACFEISEWRNDAAALSQFFVWLNYNHVPMIGFNTLGYDYNIIHAIWNNPNISYTELYELSQSIIKQPIGGFRRMVWESDRFTPQIDLFKIHHFDNKAKSTSLKALEINMRSELVLEAGIDWDLPVTEEQLRSVIIPYNLHDVRETKKFAKHSLKALEFRAGIADQLDGDVMNFNDTKIGEKLLEKRLGPDLCYTRDPITNKRTPRQSPRNRIALNDVIFPYIGFTNPEFKRVLDWMRGQVLSPADLDDYDSPATTKGVFNGVVAHVGGIEYAFGTGGIHGSVNAQRFVADENYIIRDIDVASLYPSIGIVNRIGPEHLGPAFVDEYAKLPAERKEWQAKKGKKCVEANSLKLAGNGAYGKSNSAFSFLYDPKYTMTITINGQLMLCMLAERLNTVPTLQVIQINTDGITYRIHKSFEFLAAEICKKWEAYTCLTLEAADYSRMWIRDVNNYIAESLDGSLKQKGAYWHPADGEDYATSISEQQPPAWHKDLGNCVSIRAAVAAMVKGTDPAQFIRSHSDPFDFMCRAKVDRASRLMLGDREIQGTSRYYVAVQGAPLRKISPPPKGCQIGEFKRKSKLDDLTFNNVMREIGPGVWDERIHAKNKGRYEMREMAFEAGWLVAECNRASDFRFDNVNYQWYVNEAAKLIIQ